MNPYFKKPILRLSLILSVTFVISCARMSSPTGGPEDKTPPVPLKSKPINYSTNFLGDRFLIQFDEFIVLKNINQELLVSPPLPEKPDVRLRGKNLIVKINNELADTTTYNYNFYNAIADLNENNPLPNFQFEFSTGPEFDSLYLGGTMTNAFNYKAEAGMYVMLYDEFNDTLPRTTLPALVAKTDENGHFFVTNLKKKPYYIFGLKDMNYNMLFDLPNESIAFIDSTFSPGYKEAEFTDTLKLISNISPNSQDTVYRDSVIYFTKMVTTIDDIHLFFFTEDFEPQYFNQAHRFERQQVVFAFNREVDSNFKAKPIVDFPINQHWFIQEKQLKNDSIVLWIKDSAVFNIDSLYFSLSYTLKDSNNEDYIRTDTILTYFETKVEAGEKESKEKKGGRFGLNNLFNNKEEETAVDSAPPPSELTFNTTATSPFELNKPIELSARFPISRVDEKQILLSKYINDSTKVAEKINVVPDSINLRNYLVFFKVDEEQKYELYIPQGTFTDIYGNINDSLNFAFSSRELAYYSTIKLHISDVMQPSMVQLLDEKEKLIEERPISGDTTLHFEYLPPKKFIFKLFYDPNNNGEWDTGNYGELKQPEAVFYFPQEVETKSNWDMEYDWSLYPVGPPDLTKKSNSKSKGKK